MILMPQGFYNNTFWAVIADILVSLVIGLVYNPYECDTGFK